MDSILTNAVSAVEQATVARERASETVDVVYRAISRLGI
jgi:hypothetical protein